MAPNSAAPVTSTGPTSKAPLSIAALRDRLESIETAIQRLQANRKPQPTKVAGLQDASPMAQVQDGQYLRYSRLSGQYVPTFVDRMQNAYGSTFININEATGAITIQQGGCGPLIISAPVVEINTLVQFGFQTQFAQQATFNGGIIETTGHVTLQGLPTSSSGLSTGRLWRSGTTVMVV